MTVLRALSNNWHLLLSEIYILYKNNFKVVKCEEVISKLNHQRNDNYF